MFIEDGYSNRVRTSVMAHTTRFDGSVAIVDRSDGDKVKPIEFGRSEFLASLRTNNVTVEVVEHWTEVDADPVLVIGYTDDPIIKKLLGEEIQTPEAVIYQWVSINQGTALVVAGSDDRGLMYALLELAERIESGGSGQLDSVEDTVETPDNSVRGVDRFITGPVQDTWLYDEAFWHSYLQRLARNRFNRFVLIAGYDSAFMSPPYPFIIDVPGYPDVGVPENQVDISQDEHQEVLRTVGRLCAEYSIEFYFGIWQQRPDWKEDQGTLVEGLPDDPQEFADYCTAGLEQLLVEISEIDGLQLRVNWESGVSIGDMETYDKDRSVSTAEAFWREIITAVEQAADERDRPLKLDLRAKGLTDDMIQWALETGLDITVPTKFWCESTGLPHHNTQMRQGELANLEDENKSRRYGYSDLLRKPRYYDVLYRLWVIGTNRIFLWGDPDYARRFSYSTQFGDALGFEVTAPLSLKGGHFHLQDEPWPLFDDSSFEHYEWEDERYWAWYLFFGRLGYSTDTDPDVWEREFYNRFGDAAELIRKAYRSASKILPLLTAAHLTRHPALTNWAEMDTGGALFAEHNFNPQFEQYEVTYMNAEPSDPGLFYGIDEFVQDVLADECRNKYTPLQVRQWYRQFASETRTAVVDAERAATDTDGEFRTTVLDLRMLADLAEYHAEKTAAALALAFYQETQDQDYLSVAYRAAQAAREAWTTMADRGREAYHDDLVFGMGPSRADSGQWIDRLEEIDADIEELSQLIKQNDIDMDYKVKINRVDLDRSEQPSFNFPSIDITLPETVRAGEAIEVEVQTGELNPHQGLTLHYRHTDQTEGSFEQIEMDPIDRGYRATIPGDYVTAEWDLQLYCSSTDEAGDALLYPGIYHADEPAPYVVIAVEP